MTTKPNFFLVGAPKCGTTSLYYYLMQHPDVFMPKVKEPHYFGKDLSIASGYRTTSEADYSKLFDDAGAASRLGEASVWYLYSKTAARELKAFNPDSKIVAILRHPVDLMYSLHGQFLHSGNEDEVDFEEALRIEPLRKRGQLVPASAHHPGGLLYSDTVSFSDQVERYLDAFGPDRVLVLLFDDLRKDPEVLFERLLGFLELRSDVPIDFTVHNSAESKGLRNLRFRRILKRHPSLLKIAGSIPEDVREPLGRFVASISDGRVERPTRLDAATRARHTARFDDDIRRLSKLIGRDLSSWESEAPVRSGHGV